MSDRASFTEARDNSTSKPNGLLSFDLWKSIADKRGTGAEVRANPFIGFDGELTEEGKKILGLIAAGADPRSALDGGKCVLRTKSNNENGGSRIQKTAQSE